jgi:Kef-type K+ transport system membrane component KefB
MVSSSGLVNGGAVLSSAIARLLLQLLLITGIARCLGWLLKKIKEPMVIAEMLAGICLGPTLLSRWTGFRDVVFPPESIRILEVVSQVGLLLFMFLVGAELDLPQLRGRMKATALVSLAGVLVPFACAVPTVFLLDGANLLADGASIGAMVMYLGMILSISALPVLARIISEYRMQHTSLGVFVLAVVTLEDLASWPLLALAIALAGASSLLTVAWVVILLVLDVLLLFLFFRPVLVLMTRWTRAHHEGSPIPQTVVFGVLFLVFLSAFVTEVMGLTFLIGAFQIGLIIPRSRLLAELAMRIEDLVVVVFLPLFFTVSGLRTNLGELNTIGLWGLAGALVLITMGSKVGGCTPAARWIARMSWVDSIAFGIMMNTKGLVALVALNIGLEYDLITKELFAMLVVVVIIDTFITSPALHFLYKFARRERPGAATHKPPILLCATGEGEIGTAVSVAAALSRQTQIQIIRFSTELDRPSVYMNWRLRRRDPVLRLAMQRVRVESIRPRVLCYPSANAAADLTSMAREESSALVIVTATSPHELRTAPFLTHLISHMTSPLAVLLPVTRRSLHSQITTVPTSERASEEEEDEEEEEEGEDETEEERAGVAVAAEKIPRAQTLPDIELAVVGTPSAPSPPPFTPAASSPILLIRRPQRSTINSLRPLPTSPSHTASPSPTASPSLDRAIGTSSNVVMEETAVVPEGGESVLGLHSVRRILFAYTGEQDDSTLDLLLRLSIPDAQLVICKLEANLAHPGALLRSNELLKRCFAHKNVEVKLLDASRGPYNAIAAEANSSYYSLLALSWLDPHSLLLRQLAHNPAIPPMLLIKHPPVKEE